MLDNMLNDLKAAVGKDVQHRTGLDPAKADQAIDLAGQSAKEVAEEEVRKGNIQGLMSLMNAKSSPTQINPVVSKIGANLVAKLVSTLGLTPAMAKQVEGVVVPLMIGYISERFEKEGMGGMMGMMGGKMGGLGGMLGGLFK